MTAPLERPLPVFTSLILLTYQDQTPKVLLQTLPPTAPLFPRAPALPLCGVDAGRDADTLSTARRLAGPFLSKDPAALLFTGSFSGRLRDPRGWSICLCYCALALASSVLLPDGATLTPLPDLPDLPSDHTQQIRQTQAHVQTLSERSSLPLLLLPDTFTFEEMHAVYQAFLGRSLNMVTFRRKIEQHHVITPLPGQKRMGSHRPAQLYKRIHSSMHYFDISHF